MDLANNCKICGAEPKVNVVHTTDIEGKYMQFDAYSCSNTACPWFERWVTPEQWNDNLGYDYAHLLRDPKSIIRPEHARQIELLLTHSNCTIRQSRAEQWIESLSIVNQTKNEMIERFPFVAPYATFWMISPDLSTVYYKIDLMHYGHMTCIAMAIADEPRLVFKFIPGDRGGLGDLIYDTMYRTSHRIVDDIDVAIVRSYNNEQRFRTQRW